MEENTRGKNSRFRNRLLLIIIIAIVVYFIVGTIIIAFDKSLLAYDTVEKIESDYIEAIKLKPLGYIFLPVIIVWELTTN
jgi:flagellar basal body-associated protein FliL